jgi:hypothetical protein
MESVLDSCSILKEGEAKDTLINAVKDCFDHKDKALDFKEALIEQLDTLYSKAQADSVSDFDKTLDGCYSKDEEKEEEKAEDSDKEKEEETKDSDSEEKAEDSDKEKEEEAKDSEEKAEDSDKEKEEADVKDSLTTEKVTQMIKDSLADNLKPLILETVKECLGIKDKKEEAKGFVFDSKSTELESNFDYSSFLDC